MTVTVERERKKSRRKLAAPQGGRNTAKERKPFPFSLFHFSVLFSLFENPDWRELWSLVSVLHTGDFLL
jgi:hypothetical protein